jgi:hypothetical protein
MILPFFHVHSLPQRPVFGVGIKSRRAYQGLSCLCVSRGNGGG